MKRACSIAWVSVVLVTGVLGASPPQAPTRALYPIQVDGKFGYIDRTGTVVVPPTFDHAWPFEGEMGLVRMGSFYGYVDDGGKTVIAPTQITVNGTFSDGVALVGVGGAPTGAYRAMRGVKFGLMDKKGTWLVEPKYDQVGRFAEGLASVRLGEKWGFVDRSGREAIAPKYDGAREFGGGLAPVNVGGVRDTSADEPRGGRWGYVDRTGKLAIAARFDGAHVFHDGRAAVVDLKAHPGAAVYIDATGAEVIAIEGASGNAFVGGLAVISTREGKYGYINRAGKLVIPPQYVFANDFSEGLAAVKVGVPEEPEPRYGYIDTRGTFIIRPRFENAAGFQRGVAYVQLGTKHGAIGRKGEFVIQPEYDGWESMPGVLIMRSGAGQVFFDESGKRLWPAQRDR